MPSRGGEALSPGLGGAAARAWRSSGDWLDRIAGELRRRRMPTWLLGCLIALLTWEPAFGAIGPGLDASWTAGLQMAVHRGFDFGTDVVFTYGPLGFLHTPTVWYGDLAVLAFLYSAALYVAFCCSLVWALRGSLGTWGTVAVAFFVLALLPPIEQSLVVAAVWSLGVLSRDRPRFALEGLVVGGATLAAFESLIKITLGPLIFAVCLLALVGARADWRRLVAFVALYLAELALLWAVSGQSFANLNDYVANVVQIVSGYSQAMGAQLAPSWQAPVAVITLLALVGAGAAGSYRDPRARTCGVAIVALAGFLTFKQGLVRFEVGHVGFYFATVCALWLAIPWAYAQRAICVAGALVIGAVAMHVIPGGSSANIDVIENVRHAGTQVKTLFSPSRRAAISEQGRATLKGVYRLDQRMLADLRGHSVDVDPWEIAAAWAYDLDWDPLPVFQNYSAYTPDLDRLNVKQLLSDAGPERILRENPPLIDGQYPTRTIDDRYPGWDPPAQSRAVLCNFAPLYTTARWQVLGRTADRCGRPELIRSVDAGYGETVSVPAPSPGEVVFASIHGAAVGGLERLRTFLYRSKARFAVVNGQSRFRLIPGTAADGLLLRASGALTGTGGPFTQAPQAETIELTGASGSLRFDFFRMTLRPAPPAGRGARP